MIAFIRQDLAHPISVGAILMLALAGSPAVASGPQATCKTYRPIEAVDESLGSKSAFAYFVSADRACSVVLMISEKFDPDGPPPPSASRVRLLLHSGQSVSMDSEEGRSLNILCGRDAAFIRVTTGPREAITALRQNVGLSLCALDAAK